ncbi:hypothetical protein BDV96DRAFT_157389 [Lophiotrema nucula]|uniref:DUF2264 domain-containing protein n=1 Tax=Lophiotrema nucula TaxID=690887 RepID=A0A6A5Z128_9PLEO|nr:hypothetical protein BDV96DRAFT_157389 [Lophiotrema nucula]
MPPLDGFSDNSFTTHNDFNNACLALLRALRPYQSTGGARIKLPLATGTHFDEVAAQLEGFARPLWAVGALLHGGCLMEAEQEAIVQPYVEGLANGTDPQHPEYWGPVVVRDQRMVEMEIISFALLAAPDALFNKQTKAAQKNITTWLKTINGKDFPTNNWLWFRVMTNLALVKVCSVPYHEVKAFMMEDLDQMETFYLGQGWAADGIWSDDGRQADYYSGSFAIQFSQLLYAKVAGDLDPIRCATFQERAKEFSATFWRYFNPNGAAIPFGRSLTYRFACAGFWSAAAFAGIELPEPLGDWGIVKGLLLRHFRWWSHKHDIFNVDGTLTIGFTFPNMYLGEDYNSPQSPYWAMKSFVALGLSADHPFWTCEEKALPTPTEHRGNMKQIAALAHKVEAPMQVVCNTGHHHFLLSAGQFCPWPLKATEAKYGKFAYSSHFGFSVPTGSTVLAQIAPDSTLALSKDDGDTWRVPWKVHKYEFSNASLRSNADGVIQQLPTIVSSWRPWKDAEVEVTTVLIAPSTRWPDWYLRVHKIIGLHSLKRNIRVVQGGFAIQGRKSNAGEVLPVFTDSVDIVTREDTTFAEGTLETREGSLICSDAGASGIRMLLISSDEQSQANLVDITGEILKPDANTNLMWQRTLIPSIRFSVDESTSQQQDSLIFVTAVLALARDESSAEAYDKVVLRERWDDFPVVLNSDGKSSREPPDDYIEFTVK